MYTEYNAKSFGRRPSDYQDHFGNQFNRLQDAPSRGYSPRLSQNGYKTFTSSEFQDFRCQRQPTPILESVKLVQKRARSTTRLLMSPLERSSSSELSQIIKFTDNLHQDVIQEPVRKFLDKLKGKKPNPQSKRIFKQTIQCEQISTYIPKANDPDESNFPPNYSQRLNSAVLSQNLQKPAALLPSYLKPNPFRAMQHQQRIRFAHTNEAANKLYEEVKEDLVVYQMETASYRQVKSGATMKLASSRDNIGTHKSSIHCMNQVKPPHIQSYSPVSHINSTGDSKSLLESSLFKFSSPVFEPANMDDDDETKFGSGNVMDSHKDDGEHVVDGDQQGDDLGNSDEEADPNSSDDEDDFDNSDDDSDDQDNDAVTIHIERESEHAAVPEKEQKDKKPMHEADKIELLLANKKKIESSDTRPPSSITLESMAIINCNSKATSVEQGLKEESQSLGVGNNARKNLVSMDSKVSAALNLLSMVHETAGYGEHVVKKNEVKKSRRRQKLEQAPPRCHSALISSQFPNVPPCIRFIDENDKIDALPWEFRKLLQWRASMLTPMIVKNVLSRSNFRCSKLTNITEDLETVESSDWIYYFGKHMRPAVFASIRDYQKVNHLPCSFQLGRKDRLWRNLSTMQNKFGMENFGFVPQTFCLPTDLDKFKDAWDSFHGDQQWILKPPAAARGIGIRLVNKWSQIAKKRPLIVQRYLSSPYLINGSKFDLRIYVFVCSLNPLCVFVHEDGLTRFASHKYSNSPRLVGNRFIHLTNYSINRLNSEYIPNSNELVCKGHKWSLRALWKYFRENDVDPNPIWNSIKDVIVKTCISIESPLKMAISTYCNSARSAQELFGFDIFLDENLKPWLLEVNVSPSMHSDSQLDVKVKGCMIKDMLNLTGINLPQPKDVANASVKTLHLTTPKSNLDTLTTTGISSSSHLVEIKMSGGNPTLIQASASFDEEKEDTTLAEILGPTSYKATKPCKPAHPWVMDKRLDIKQLSVDERAKQEYYILRAYEAELPSLPIKVNQRIHSASKAKPRPIIHSSSTSIPMQLKVSPQKTSEILAPILVSDVSRSEVDESKHNTSTGIGPDSFDLDELILLRENQRRLIQEKQTNKRMLIQSILSNRSPGTCLETETTILQTVNYSRVPELSLPMPVQFKPVSEPIKENVLKESKQSSVERLRWVTQGILDCITPYDLRCLIQLIDLRSRAGDFQCIFPVDETDKASVYLGFFERPRYANFLIAAFLDQYGSSSDGVKLISSLCEKGVHLKSGFFGDELDPSNVWQV